ncbi:MAG: peptide MFS transporter [Cytophagales bacterium]
MKNTLTQQPKGLFLLFFVEMWERFSFYGMKGLLIYFMTQHFLYEENFAYDILGAYGALVYAGPVFGGYLAEKFLGYKNSIIIGGIVMMLGHFAMFFLEENSFFAALAMVAIGNGFFKPNISSTVGQLYGENDSRRDTGFYIFYLGINLGAFGQLLCAALGENLGWHYGFSLAGIGMGLGLLIFMIRQKKDLNGIGEAPKITKKISGISYFQLVLIGCLMAIPLYMFLLKHKDLLDQFVLYPIAALSIVYLVWEGWKRTKVDRQRMAAAVILTFFSVIFWAFFEQAGSSISLFIKKCLDRNVFGYEIVPSAFQSVNPGYIIIFAPMMSIFWSFLDSKNLKISIPVKFALGMLMLGVGFGIFAISYNSADANGIAPLYFFMLGYLVLTLGELCLSPIGLSMITQLAPKGLTGMMMGLWMLSSSFAHSVGAVIAKTTSMDESVTGLPALKVYTEVFSYIGWTAIGAGVILFLISPLLQKWISSKD